MSIKIKKATSTTVHNLTSLVGSAKCSPQMNLIHNREFLNHHKIPLSTDNQLAQHKFEFPISKGNSGSEDEVDNCYFNRLMDINLSSSLSPNQNFTPLNRLHEISPYNKLPAKYSKLELDSYSDKSNPQKLAYSVQNKTGRIPRKSSGSGAVNSYG